MENNWPSILDRFVFQAQSGKDLKFSSYPKEWSGLKLRVSFGQGVAARIPWMAFIAPEMAVSKGFYPVYLYYKDLGVLVLAYGISETEEFGSTWPPEIVDSTKSITAFFDKDVPRYGDSFVFKAYKIGLNNGKVQYTYPEGNLASGKDIESDLEIILERYKKVVSIEATNPESTVNQGLFYMEKELENFLIENWERTPLGRKYELIREDGEVVSQQYKADAIGKIDILARDRKSNAYVVIELKKAQSTDDTVGQVTRYMGWIKEDKKDPNVQGIIIAAEHDKKLAYALKVVPNVKVFLYKVDFNLMESEGSIS